MKNLYITVMTIYILSFSSCGSGKQLTGVYYKAQHTGNAVTRPIHKILWGSTFVYGESIELKPNKTFYYWSSTSCLVSAYDGQWDLQGDTLLLSAFDSTYNNRMKEQYLIQGKKLKPITNDNFGLTLKKIKNEP